MTDFPEGALKMAIMANQNEGRYLLPKRYHRDDAEKNALYDAAEWLVDHGYARKLSPASSFAPGIRLTGKPLPPS